MMSINFDNTETWQRDGNTLFLLQRSAYPKGMPKTENKFSINIQGTDYEKEELIEKILNFLNNT